MLTAQQGLPTKQFLYDFCGDSVLIFDDLNHSASNFDLGDLFRVFTHHQNTTILFLQHNLFDPSFWDARHNSHVIILTSNFKNLNVCGLLSRELFAYQKNLIGRALKHIIRDKISPYDQLVINLQVSMMTPSTDCLAISTYHFF